MVEIPLVTEEDLWDMGKAEVVTVAMKLQQLALLQEHQIELMQKVMDLQQGALDAIVDKDRESK